jgi:hypothetical protein
LNILDWVQVGRYAAGLDVITTGNEFRRVDCAPRDTLGDGEIKVTDWVQAGRYAVGLDPLTIVGGPDAPNLILRPDAQAAGGGLRKVRLSGGETVTGLTVTLPLVLESQANENGIGVSLNFDPTVLRYVGVSGVASTANINVNASQAAAGRVGVLLVLPTGSTFSDNDRQIARVTFVALASVEGEYPISLDDYPVRRSVSDAYARELEATYSNAQVVIRPTPTLNISNDGTNVVVTWPAWATGFMLQTAESLGPAPQWSDLSSSTQTDGTTVSVTLPRTTALKYFRLFHR